ncbi:MAG: hypothetical protein B0D91_06385 [Oceanospirillales bacterium LUC14_002_19_P2]|nr:MAG: hypothetical protein B0D91_06385 [Oceanospirillales bacterium LUC14_002_19_P2]
MSINALTGLLRQHIGLDPESIGQEAIEQSIKRRMSASGLDNPDLYFMKVTEDPVELTALVDEITVGETWFFREFRAFSVLQEKALGSRSRLNGLTQFRVASMPCSSGEEAYSIAMALFDIGLLENQFVVDGYDINTDAMRKARKAEYGRVSFRGTMPDFSKPYFKKHGDGFSLKPMVKQCVSFHQANLLELANNAEPRLYDVIFCRNFLIYLDAPSRKRMADVLRRSLAEDGILMVGHCEAPSIAQLGFHTLARDKRFAFSKASRDALAVNVVPPLSRPAAAAESKKQPEKFPLLSGKPALRSGAEASKAATVSHVKTKPSTLAFARPSDELMRSAVKTETAREAPAAKPREAVESLEDKLDAIEMLADSGKLDKAKEACRQLMRQHPENVEAQFLMGVISEAAGEWASAFQYFRKVLYLHPEHHEALLHGAMVCERQGEMAKAQNLRTRLSRLIG